MALLYYNQPATGTLYAAYRPIVLEVRDGTPEFGTVVAIPIVYMDVYINGTYYKSLSSTSSRNGSFFGTGTYTRKIWTFDLQDVFQEYLRSEPPTLSLPAAETAPAAISTFFAKARGSSVNTNGFIIPDGPAPIQGNFDTAPTSGGGVQSNNFVAANATLQHEDYNNLHDHLQLYKHPDVDPFATMEILPLSHRPVNGAYLNCLNQCDHFPVLIPYNGVHGGNGSITLNFDVYWVEADGTTGSAAVGTTGALNIASAPSIYNIPTGLRNIKTMFVSPPAGLSRAVSYRLELTDGSAIVWSSGWITVGGCCPDGGRIHFLNNAGGFDSVNFCQRQEVLSIKSAAYQKSLPLSGMQRRDFGHQRLNIVSNEKVTLSTAEYEETEQPWLKELLDSPRAYLETISQGDGNLPDLIPIIITDGDFAIRKVDDRFTYQLDVAYVPSNENIRQRG
jgi:hypothetical protein